MSASDSSNKSSTNMVFPIGSAFVSSIDNKSSSATINIAENVTLAINTATLKPGCCYYDDTTTAMACLYASFPPESPTALPLCTFNLLQSPQQQQYHTITSLGIKVTGPREITLNLVILDQEGTQIKDQRDKVAINVFGSIEPSSWITTNKLESLIAADSSLTAVVVTQTVSTDDTNLADADKGLVKLFPTSAPSSTTSERKNMRANKLSSLIAAGSLVAAIVVTQAVPTADTNVADTDEGLVKVLPTSATSSATLERKRLRDEPNQQQPLPLVEEGSNTDNHYVDTTAATTDSPRIMSKKAKLRLAKQKQQELADVMSKEFGFEAKKEFAKQKQQELADVIRKKLEFDSNNIDEVAVVVAPNKKKKVIPPRRLKGGVIVQDEIIGSGAAVKQGRKVSILYVGSLEATGKVFDKNQQQNKPLQFRLGTGEVIRGLDMGLEGMKVGGERTVTIPPELGYGNQAMGDKIPRNSTLVFQVRMIR